MVPGVSVKNPSTNYDFSKRRKRWGIPGQGLEAAEVRDNGERRGVLMSFNKRCFSYRDFSLSLSYKGIKTKKHQEDVIGIIRLLNRHLRDWEGKKKKQKKFCDHLIGSCILNSFLLSFCFILGSTDS